MSTQDYTTKHTTLQTHNEQEAAANDGAPAELTLNPRVRNYIDKIEPIAQGERNSVLHKVGIRLRGAFALTGGSLEAALSEVNHTKCDPPLPDDEVAGIAASVDKSKTPVGNAGGTFRHSGRRASPGRKEYYLSMAEEPSYVAELLCKEISTYSDCRANTPNGTTTIGDFLEMCRTGGEDGEVKSLIEFIRDEEDKEKRNELKKGLPAYVLASEPQERRKANACVPNKILSLDIDDIPEDKIEAEKSRIADLPYVFAVVLSASGRGLFALAAYDGTPDLKNLLTAMQADFPAYKLDKSCSDLSRLRFMTFDENLIVKDVVFPATLNERMVQGSTQSFDVTTAGSTGVPALDEFCEKLERYEFPSQAKVSAYYVGSIQELLRTIRAESLDLAERHGDFYFFNGQWWQIIEPTTLKIFLRKVTLKLGVPECIALDYKFQEKVRAQFQEMATFPFAPADKVIRFNLANGTLEFPIGQAPQLVPFDKKHGLTYQLGYNYNPAAKCPLYTKFLERCVPCEDNRKILLEYLAYVLARQLNYEKVLFLRGMGHNGKSVFLASATALFGKINVLSLSLENITMRADYRAQLSQGLLNICSETSQKLDPAVFKAMASREPIDCRNLYDKPFNLEGTEYATLLFATNTLPKEAEATNAYFRRFLIVPFDETITEEERDHRLNRVEFWENSPEELSGLMNEVVAGLMRLLTNDGFTQSQSADRALEEYRVNSDSVLSFMREEGFEPSRDEPIKLKELYEYYVDYCREGGMHPVSNKTLAQRLRIIGYTVELGTGKVNYVYCTKPSKYNSSRVSSVWRKNVTYKKIMFD